jgi:hypothetical protein
MKLKFMAIAVDTNSSPYHRMGCYTPMYADGLWRNENDAENIARWFKETHPSLKVFVAEVREIYGQEEE